MSRKKSNIDNKRLKEIGNRILSVRNSAGETQGEFSDHIGIAANSLSEIENGKREISKPALLAIEYRYRISKEYILTGKGDMHGAPPSPSSSYPPELQPYLDMAAEILQSKSEHSEILKIGIRAFHNAVVTEETDLQKLKRDMEEFKEDLHKVMDLLYSKKKNAV
ncbi:MAG: helix-turn-helix transcriptional regulator [Deltaproteobacteria bacterium]|nr:helix-turn-helix transcriptional regulator [Deltaproteobacteria bacterium]